MIEEGNDPDRQSSKVVAHVVYGLFALGIFTGLLAGLIGVIIAHVKRSDVRGTWLEDHFRWQIRSFWFAFLWSLVGAALIVVYIGALVLLGVMIWYIYRIVKGWLRLVDERRVYQTD